MDDLMQNVPRANCITLRLTLGLLQKCPEGKNGVPSDGPWDCPKMPRGQIRPPAKRWTLRLSENVVITNPDTSQRLPPLSPLSPINIVHPSKGRRGSYL